MKNHCLVSAKWKWKSLSHVWLFVTTWTIQFMEFPRPELWIGYPFPSPGDPPNPRIEPRSPALQADSLPAESHGKPKKTGMGSLSLLQWIFPMQDKPAFPALQVDSLPTELSGKSKGTLNSQSFDCLFSSIFFSFTLSYLCLNFLWVFNSLLGEFSSLRLNSLCKLISTYDNLPSHFLICLF